VLETYNDQQWLENFENLCRELEPQLKPNESFVRAQVDVKKQVAIAIYFINRSTAVRKSLYSFIALNSMLKAATSGERYILL
jgi:hypothetical protein